MNRIAKVLSEEEFKKLSTQRLLNYLKQLNRCEESFEKSDRKINTDLDNPNFIQYKATDKWKKAHQTAKSILNNREHIEKKSGA